MLKVDGQKIEIAQALQGIPSEALPGLTGLSKITILSMKKGNPCKPVSVSKLAKALKVDIKDILKD